MEYTAILLFPNVAVNVPNYIHYQTASVIYWKLYVLVDQ